MEIGDRVLFTDCDEDNMPFPYYGLLDVRSAEPLYFVTAMVLSKTGIKVSVNYSDVLFDIETLKYVNAPLSPSMEKLASLCDVEYDIAKKVSATPVASSSASKHIPAIPKAAPQKVPLTKFEKLVHMLEPFSTLPYLQIEGKSLSKIGGKSLCEIQALMAEGFGENDFTTSGQIVTDDELHAFADTERIFLLEKLEFVDLSNADEDSFAIFVQDAAQILRRNGFYS